MRTVSEFTNELGNDVAIEVLATNHVDITITGPTSTITNSITIMEAVELMKCLKEIFWDWRDS